MRRKVPWEEALKAYAEGKTVASARGSLFRLKKGKPEMLTAEEGTWHEMGWHPQFADGFIGFVDSVQTEDWFIVEPDLEPRGIRWGKFLLQPHYGAQQPKPEPAESGLTREMFAIYSLTPAPWGDDYRLIEMFEKREDAEAVLAALERVNILCHDYRIVDMRQWLNEAGVFLWPQPPRQTNITSGTTDN